MKSVVALAAMAASQAYAQNVTYSTETYTSCDSSTVTGTKIVTTPCSESKCTATPTDAARAGHVTTWVTSYTAFCPTASADNYQKVYTTTVTESCSGATPTWSYTNAGYVPPAWTTGPMVCTECGTAPMTMPQATYPIAVAPSGTVVPEKMQTPAPQAPAPVPGAQKPAAAPSVGSFAPPNEAAASPAPEKPVAASPEQPASPAPGVPAASAPGSPAAGSPEMPAASSPETPAGSAPGAPPAAAGPASPDVTSVQNFAKPPKVEEAPAGSPSPMYLGGAGALAQPLTAAVALVGAVAAAFCML